MTNASIFSSSSLEYRVPLAIRFAVLAMASPPMARFMASAFSLRQPISNQPFCGEANEAPVNKILYSVVFDRFCATAIPVKI